MLKGHYFLRRIVIYDEFRVGIDGTTEDLRKLGHEIESLKRTDKRAGVPDWQIPKECR